MKQYYIVSLIKNGLLGGGITADSQSITYHTGKVTVPQKYRHLVMNYSDICSVTTGRFLLLPTVTVTMQNGEENRFVIFFNRNRFLQHLKQMGVEV